MVYSTDRPIHKEVGWKSAMAYEVTLHYQKNVFMN